MKCGNFLIYDVVFNNMASKWKLGCVPTIVEVGKAYQFIIHASFSTYLIFICQQFFVPRFRILKSFTVFCIIHLSSNFVVCILWISFGAHSDIYMRVYSISRMVEYVVTLARHMFYPCIDYIMVFICDQEKTYKTKMLLVLALWACDC